MTAQSVRRCKSGVDPSVAPSTGSSPPEKRSGQTSDKYRIRSRPLQSTAGSGVSSTSTSTSTLTSTTRSRSVQSKIDTGRTKAGSKRSRSVQTSIEASAGGRPQKPRPLVTAGQLAAAGTGRSRKETALDENSPVVVTEVKAPGWKSKFVKFFDVFVQLFQVRAGLIAGHGFESRVR